jgi:hypothetical protein
MHCRRKFSLATSETKTEPQESKMQPEKPEEEKRSELIDELLRRHEPLIARAVESAPGCRFENGVLFLDYQDPLYTAWAKVLTDVKQKPGLEAAAKQIAIVVEVVS